MIINVLFNYTSHNRRKNPRIHLLVDTYLVNQLTPVFTPDRKNHSTTFVYNLTQTELKGTVYCHCININISLFLYAYEYYTNDDLEKFDHKKCTILEK